MTDSLTHIEWIEAPTSGVLHVAGEGYPRRECLDGIRLLCGWVIHSTQPTRVRDEDKRGKRCSACSAWLRRQAEGRT